jgi:POT family proton-dependent oligopeptide transporter
MKTHALPNDIMANIDPLATLILLPVFDRIIFPSLRRLGLSVGHFDRILSGFLVCGVSMLCAAYLQQKVYMAPPCYDHPRADTCHGGRTPNHISVFLQTPVYVLTAISEILASVARVEYAYTKAPKSMKSLVMAIYLSTVSVGTLLAMTVSPLTQDPKLVWMYLTLALSCLLASTGIWLTPL